ncbi:hypothetical protein ONE63_009286 [Megalurothrips usitatus]|uniref:Insulin-like growth factor-binding protein-related protein 1 n=1 Tax=Megalurothrips usitatus TaxID=439358 RepID=A0AAV7XJ45_9NEOP|nr:hypothetical protein ONE63_009286 [Megalurothrips usitatus]
MLSLLVILLAAASSAAPPPPSPSEAPAAPVPAGSGWEPLVEQFTELPPTPPEPSTQPPEPGCRPCSPARCPRAASECRHGAGLAADPCGCCPHGVCGLPEGARCYNASSGDADLADRALGVCGDNMDCLPRSDLGATERTETQCVCREVGSVCGSDNTTYASACQLKPERPADNKDEPAVKVWLRYRGPCRSAPRIVTPPAPVSHVLGSPVSLECEVKGNPAPFASWERISKDGIATPLPSDDASLVMMVRGGPEPFMATSWLQIVALREHDVGAYICVATNSEGSARAAAEVSILPSSG